MAANKLAALQRCIFHKKLRIALNAGSRAQVVGRATLGSIERQSVRAACKSPNRFSDFRT